MKVTCLFMDVPPLLICVHLRSSVYKKRKFLYYELRNFVPIGIIFQWALPHFSQKFLHNILDLYTACAYIYFMSFEWDQNKATINLKKHRIDFADAVTVFDDFNTVTVNDPDHDEERFVTIGMDAYGRILVVVYTWRGDVIRLISARKATKHERKQYEE